MKLMNDNQVAQYHTIGDEGEYREDEPKPAG